MVQRPQGMKSTVASQEACEDFEDLLHRVPDMTLISMSQLRLIKC